MKYSLKDTFYSNAELAVRNIKQADNQGKEVKYSVKDKRKSAITTESAQYEHHPSVVVIADDTKVLKNIDSTIDKYENVKRANTFLGDLANAIGAKKRGGGCKRN